MLKLRQRGDSTKKKMPNTHFEVVPRLTDPLLFSPNCNIIIIDLWFSLVLFFSCPTDSLGEKRKVPKEIQGRRERFARATRPRLRECIGVLCYAPVA